MNEVAAHPARSRAARHAPHAPAMASPDVDVVVPMHNEERVIETSVRRLHAYLSADFPFPARIVIADSASSDTTPSLARALAQELESVRTVRLEEKGRGRALRAVWSASDAKVLAYMDADLSTDLRALLPLVAPLLSGHGDLAIGSRTARGARVTRCVRREVISRTYNLLLRALLHTRLSDAQCGFKAGRREVIQALLPAVENDHWFFDTELLHLAERNRLRIHEVPVDWKEDPDSRVHLLATAVEDLRGIARLRRTARSRAGDPARQLIGQTATSTNGREPQPCPRPR
jgi:glycosyltransferase involved in cell wall biosynthesis